MSRFSFYARFCGLAVLSFAVLLTCADDNPTGSDDNGGGGGLAVTPSSTDSPSGSWVSLTGLPAGDSTYYGIVTSTTKADDTGYTPVVVTDSGHYLIVPFNPSDPMHGGEVQVIIQNNSKGAAEPFTLTLDSLPPAPGEFGAVVGLMQEAFTAALAANGLTRDSLEYVDANAVPLSRVPYIMAYSTIDDPNNPNCLRAIADGTAPYFGTDSVDTDLIDRLMAHMNLRAYYEELVRSLDTLTPAFIPETRIEMRVGSLTRSSACITPPDYGIASCGALANAMQQQYALQWASQSATEQVENSLIAGTLAAATLIPGSAPLVVPISGGVWARGLIDKGFQNMFPSEFVDAATSFDPTETEFNEDFVQPGSWSVFNVTAISNGWGLDKIGVEAILQVTGAVGAGQAMQNAPGAFEDEVGDALAGMLVNPLAADLVDRLGDESDFIEICPNSWSNINCAGLDYSTVTPNNDFLDVDSAGQMYEPKEVGATILRIETKNIFGEDNSTGTAVSIETKQIEVFLDPFQAEADTTDEVMFNVRVENAEDTRVAFSMIGGGSVFDNDPEATVFTPEAPWDPPIRLRARSLANTGLREGRVDSDPREDEAEIRYQGEGIAIITPGSWCLRPGEDQDFTVTYTGSSIESVEWEIDPPGVGDIIGSGETITYRAPNQPAGNVTLSATVNDTSTGYAYVDVSSCICNWYFSAIGSSGGYTASGEWGTASGLGALVVYLDPDSTEGFNPPNVSFVSYGFNGEPGTFPIEGMNYLISADEDWGIVDTTQPLPIMNVTAYVQGDYIQGTASGTLSNRTNFNPPEYEHITFNLSFRAEFFNLERPQCVDD